MFFLGFVCGFAVAMFVAFAISVYLFKKVGSRAPHNV